MLRARVIVHLDLNIIVNLCYSGQIVAHNCHYPTWHQIVLLFRRPKVGNRSIMNLLFILQTFWKIQQSKLRHLIGSKILVKTFMRLPPSGPVHYPSDFSMEWFYIISTGMSTQI